MSEKSVEANNLFVELSRSFDGSREHITPAVKVPGGCIVLHVI